MFDLFQAPTVPGFYRFRAAGVNVLVQLALVDEPPRVGRCTRCVAQKALASDAIICYTRLVPEPLFAYTPEALCAAAPAIRLDEARKIVAMVHRDEPVVAGSHVRSVAAAAARELDTPAHLQVVTRAASAVDPFVKFMLRTEDEHRIETVRIPLHIAGRYSVCVSSQVGCAMACVYCATGRLGLARNLRAWEILEQIRIVRREIQQEARATGGPGRVHGVVFQGMGEPLANLDAVLRAIAVCREPSALGIDARAITVCTSGLPSGIRRLAAEAPKVRVAWSVGSARSDVRQQIIPIARTHGDADVLEALAYHARTTGHAPMWAVTLLRDVNDSDADAEALAALTARFATETGQTPRLSLIPYNPIGAADPFARTSDEREAAFRSVLAAAGLAHHKRYSGGGDVGAACGQLVAGATIPVGRLARHQPARRSVRG